MRNRFNPVDQVPEPTRQDVSVKIGYLEKLQPIIKKAATEIRRAVFSGRPIYIRHHSDLDGFSAGVMVEKAIQDITSDPKYKFRRMSMRAPFYEIEDMLRDLSMANADAARWGNPMPLVVVLDNGSSTQDVDAITLGKRYGMDFIVCDHHLFGEKDKITDLTLAHINQVRFGNDISCAGFLAYELARMISPYFKSEHDIPVLAGIADRVEEEVFNQHLGKATANIELLRDYEQVLTWLLTIIPNVDNSAFLQTLFWSTPESKQQLVDQFLEKLNEKSKSAVKTIEQCKDVHEANGKRVVFLPTGKVIPRGTYPRNGRLTGMVFDREKKVNPATLTAGFMEDGVILRVAPETGSTVQKIISYLQGKLPFPVLGGGLEIAGTIRFPKILSEKEITKVKELIVEHVKEAKK